MARLYADEQFPRPVVEFLRNLGYDVLTVQLYQVGRADSPSDRVQTLST